MERKFKHLFKPIKIGGQQYKNRIFAAPQDFAHLTANRFLSDDAVYFYERKAQGGFASVCIGDFIICCDSGGRSHPFQMRGDDVLNKPHLTRVSQAIARHGAVPQAEIVFALNNAAPSLIKDYPGYVVGTCDFTRADGMEVHGASEEQIDAMIEAHADAASFLVQTGFRSILLHGGHGWGLHQWISEKDNGRADRWGGSLENRMRFPLAVIEAIRRRVGPSIPIEFRMSGAEIAEGGYGIEEGVRIAQMLDGKVDMVHLSCGHHEDRRALNYTHPTMFMPDGCNLVYAEEVKKVVSTPVATVGAFTDPQMMDEVIASGKADVIHLGRQSLADPDFPLKAFMNLDDEIIPCQRCTACFSYSTEGGCFYCAVNPEIGRERHAMHAPVAKRSKKVLIAGGGMGGMQAAITAADQGHEVVLCERKDTLGGVLAIERDISFKQNLHRYIERQKRMIERSGVDVRLSCEVTREVADSIGPDVIIAATGASPREVQVPGADKPHVMCFEELYLDLESSGRTVAIIGGGLIGLELGVEQARRGRRVKVFSSRPGTLATPPASHGGASSKMGGLLEVPLGTMIVHGDAIAEEMRRLGGAMTVQCNARVKEVVDEGVVVNFEGADHLVDADTVVFCAGMVPNADAALALRDCAREFYQIGDCVSPESIGRATSEGYQIALDIGRF